MHTHKDIISCQKCYLCMLSFSSLITAIILMFETIRLKRWTFSNFTIRNTNCLVEFCRYGELNDFMHPVWRINNDRCNALPKNVTLMSELRFWMAWNVQYLCRGAKHKAAYNTLSVYRLIKLDLNRFLYAIHVNGRHFERERHLNLFIPRLL